MNITIITFGTRGDVEPLLALAVGLQRAGHAVTLAAPSMYADWIRSYGVEAYPMRFVFMPTEDNSTEKSQNILRRLREFRKGVRKMAWESLEDYLQASKDADFLIQSVLVFGGMEIATKRGIPLVFAHLFPFTPTREFPSFSFAFRGSLGGRYNRWTQHVALKVTWRLWVWALNRWRSEYFSLPAWRSHAEMMDFRHSLNAPNLIANSAHALSKPLDWDALHELTGFWFLDLPQDWQAPEDLRQFLASGPPPVYVGFGNMAHGDPRQRTREVLRALEMSGQRGIIFSGGGGALARLPAPSTVFYVDNVPHAWLFPQMAAIVHHGGGSIGTGLRSGVPNIIAPVGFDHHAWADRAERLGVGIRLPDMKYLKAEKLATAISRAVTDTQMRERAAILGRNIREENGVEQAVKLIERHAAAAALNDTAAA